MFDFFKKKGAKIPLGSPVKGEAVPIQEVSDPTFGEEILGKGVAIKPVEGKFYAPADGEIALMFDTLHAVSIKTVDGVEVLIHIGLDTVALKGKYFKAHKATGDKVKKGDLLVTADLDALKAAGYDIITPMIICNTDEFKGVLPVTGNAVAPGDTVLEIEPK